MSASTKSGKAGIVFIIWNCVHHLSSRKWEDESIPVPILFGSPNVILLTL